MDYLGGYFVNFGTKDAFSRTHIFCVVQEEGLGEVSRFQSLMSIATRLYQDLLSLHFFEL